jgi:2-polyprenyl-3-methyl-5-hydroxy-6-metoxy-1,4-benzoquinol methylase
MDWKNYWQDRSADYICGLEGPYHANRLAMVKALFSGTTLRGLACIDFGCGDGAFTEHLLSEGARVEGIDTDLTMIQAAEARLRARWPDVRLLRGGVEKLVELSADSVDQLVALNVLAYFTAEEERVFYEQAARVVKKGGTLTVTHSNELFDMFTLNRYTVDFFRRNFSFGARPCEIASLLTSPDKPERRVFNVRENPLAYRYKLAEFGFREIRQEFSILHPVPPLLTPEIDFDDINSRTYPSTIGWPESERWKLMFACSIFGSHSIRDK